MGIMTRLIRIWKADVNGVMDELEDKELILRQSIRDMEEELDRKEQKLQRMRADRERTDKDLQKYRREHRDLEKDLEIAIRKDKDDIARMLIKKIKQVRRHADSLQEHQESLDTEIKNFRDLLEQQRTRLDQLKLRAKEYLLRKEREQWPDAATEAASDFSRHASEPTDEEIELELLKYKEAFQRAQGGEQ